jgi:phenylacetate-coenzyme A ligase PaaK-like adenylate-forming protein
MVRYRLDDILHLSTEQNCPCGQHSLIIDAIEGRCDDVLYLPETSSMRGIALYPDYLSRALLLNPQLIDFRITQISPICLRIQWVGSVDEANMRLAIEKVFVQHGISPTEIELQLQAVNAFEQNPMHKRRRVVGLKNNTTTHADF